ncbi:antirestriction protein ArdA [Macrococcus capreoli]|uniref:antirestriction protein ArdA n=1 Tax=Macrococcus capreoli TaxID=2982690 RepID=UPI0021D60953|nr:antirestriction protein ArdA [Macrococcus sp. TMW 2.2395]MCU7556549.1 antirestriction protein ArdA [Macrococcus sp. TMW 2.2395]
MTLLNVFIAPVSNALKGQWYDLTSEEGRDAAKLAELAITAEGKEAFISDYEAPFKVDPYSSLETLISIGEDVEAFEDDEAAAFAAFTEYSMINDVIAAIDTINEQRVIKLSKRYYSDDFDTAVGEWYVNDYKRMDNIILGQSVTTFIDCEAVGFAARCNGFVGLEGSDEEAHYFTLESNYEEYVY